MYYLLRMEPFTTLHINLQSGRFDHADRLFFSIGDTWRGVNSSSTDVKELIPEFFYLPEMFENLNKFDLGTMQNGRHIDHVELPKWASTPYEFVRLHREVRTNKLFFKKKLIRN